MSGEMSLTSAQWKLESIQLVNWGRFCSVKKFEPAADMKDETGSFTIISGDSGTGKSTLIDAFTACVMPPHTTLNGAARSGGEMSQKRSRAKYVRGYLGEIRRGDNAESEIEYLRPLDRPAYSAVFSTFTNSYGGVLCAMKVYYITEGSMELETIAAISKKRESLENLSLILDEPLTKSSVGRAYPNATIYENEARYTENLRDELGIPAGAEDKDALKLLMLFQNGKNPSSIDALFKGYVLENPACVGEAARIVKNYGVKRAIYDQYELNMRKYAELSDIFDAETAMKQAQRESARYGLLLGEGIEKAPYWEHPVYCALEEKSKKLEVQTADARRRAEEKVGQLEKAIKVKNEEAQRLMLELHKADGGQTARLEEEIRRVEETLATKRTLLAELSERCKKLDFDEIENASAFADVTSTVHAMTCDYDERKQQIEDSLYELRRDYEDTEKAVERMQAQLDVIKLTGKRTPKEDVALADEIAVAAGVERSRIAYIGEIIDIKAGVSDEWATALRKSLNNLARTLLVPAESREVIQQALDAIRAKRRVDVMYVDITTDYEKEPRENMTSSLMEFDEGSEYCDFVRGLICSNEYDMALVEQASDFKGGNGCLSAAGQTWNGRTEKGPRGAFGAPGIAELNVIGFCNEADIDLLEANIADIRMNLDENAKSRSRINREARRLAAAYDFSVWVSKRSWSDFDIKTEEEHRAELQKQLDALRQNPAIEELKIRYSGAKAEHEKLVEEKGVEKQRMEKLAEKEAFFKETATDARAAIVQLGIAADEEMLKDSNVVLDIMQDKAEVFPGDEDFVANFETIKTKVAETLRRQYNKYRQETEDKKTHLRSLMTTFADNHRIESDGYHVERGIGGKVEAGSIGVFQAMKEEIEKTTPGVNVNDIGRKIITETVDNLGRFKTMYQESIAAIDERFEAMNRILMKKPFGEQGGTLRLTRRSTRDPHDNVNTLLNPVLAGEAHNIEDGNVSERLDELDRVMKKIQDDFEHSMRYVNPQKSFQVETECDYKQKGEEATRIMSSFGSLSGGETQEALYFVLSASLYYALSGSFDRTPQYLTVFIEEAFANSDANTTKRAIDVMKAFGFQIIAAVPAAKIREFSSYIDRMYVTCKIGGGLIDVYQASVKSRRVADVQG